MKRPAAVLHDARKAIERSKRSVEEARLTIERAHRTLAVSQHQLDRLKLLQARIEWLNNAQWALWGGGRWQRARAVSARVRHARRAVNARPL